MKTRVLAYTLFALLICIAEQFYYLEWPFTKMLSASSMPSDIHYKLQPKIDCDTRIVLINTNKVDVQKIAELVHFISPHRPSVIGIHQHISASEADSIVVDTESQIIILAKDGLKVNDSSRFRHSNFVFSGKDRVIRSFKPFTDGMPSFALSLIKEADLDAYKEVLKRGNAEEQIYYSGNLPRYGYQLEGIPCRIFSIEDVMRLSLLEQEEYFKDKIVLIGDIGTYLHASNVASDYLTPYQDLGGETRMRLPIITTNALSMLLDRRDIDKTPRLYLYGLTILLAFINTLIFSRVHPNWLPFVAIILLYTQAHLIIALEVYLFGEYRLQCSSSFLFAWQLTTPLLGWWVFNRRKLRSKA